MPVGRLLAIFLIFSGAMLAAPQLTTIQDTLYKADGTRMNGTAVITWNSFEASDTSAVGMQTISVSIVNGNIYVQLVPNSTAIPPAPYTVTYSSDGKIQFQETWMVPPSTTPLRVRDVRTGSTTTVTSPIIISSGSSTLPGGSSSSSAPITESSVVGLTNDLAARPLKGPSFGTSRAAVVDQNGAIDTVVGNLTDCVYVDGSSGPCFDPSFLPTYSDGETPSGVVDGANTSFVLVGTPTPAQSLILFRNGMLQKQGFDYSLSGSSLQFLAGAGPQPGDTLMAWYRMAPVNGIQGGSLTNASGGNLTALSTAMPQVVCSANGTQAAATTPVSLGTCTIPGGYLAPGDRVEVRFLFSHGGATSGFTYFVKWGATTLLQRTGATGDANASGRADAMITSSVTQISGESFGTVLTLLPFLGSANDAVSSPIKVDFQAAAAPGSSDTVGLVNYTIIRYPAMSNP